MDSLTSGTFVGAGSFRCEHCGYVLTLEGSDALTDCPGCGGEEFVRASLFSTERDRSSASGRAAEARRADARRAGPARPRRAAREGRASDRARRASTSATRRPASCARSR